MDVKQQSPPIDRAAIEKLPPHGAFTFKVAKVGAEPDGRFIVEGRMNSFGVMRSRRILHPGPFRAWLKAAGREASLPMLVNHGLVASGLSSVGRWTGFSVDDDGMNWSGFVGDGTDLARDTRALLAQGVVDSLSLGWQPIQGRWVTIDDADLDPWLKRKLTEAGAREAYAFLDYIPVEGSVVDVPDDALARVAGGAAFASLHQAVEGLRADINALKSGGGTDTASRFLASLDSRFREFLAQWREQVVAMLQADSVVADAAEAFREDLAALREDKAKAGDEDLDTLLDRVSRVPS